jgi:predicted RNA binding protein YcfA (HicA-like mRNA interferase family)
MVLYWYCFSMPPKIRELLTELKRCGFVNRGGKGSHRNLQHPDGLRVTISGKLGDDAKPYQLSEVHRALEQLENEDI